MVPYSENTDISILIEIYVITVASSYALSNDTEVRIADSLYSAGRTGSDSLDLVLTFFVIVL